jgi:hypothetical protein
MRWLIGSVFVLAACRSEPSDAPPQAIEPPRVVECAATHQAIGTACVPRFDACAAGEIALVGGGCRAVGVPHEGCAPGFVHDGKGACDPVLPAKCDKGQYARPGEPTCRPVDACGADRYPAVASAVHVDASYVGTSDGSADKPFRTIAEAVARPGATTIAIAAGRYVEDVVIDRAVRVVGVCSEKVEIVGSMTGLDAAAVLVRAGATIEQVSITGAAQGVLVDSAASVRVDRVRVHDTESVGIWIRRGASAVTIANTLVEQASRYGIVVTGSTAAIEDSVVRATRYNTTGAGIQANPTSPEAPASVKVDRCVIEQNEGAGVAASGATISMDASVVRDTLPHPDGTWGVSALAEVHPPSKLAGKLVLSRSVLERSRYFGVVATASHASLDRVVVRDVEPELKSGKLGRGVAITGPSGAVEMTIRDSAIMRTHETGIDSVGNAKLTVERTLVADVRAIEAAGSGIAAIRYDKTGVAPKVVVRETAIERSGIAGVLANGELELHAVRIDASGAYGVIMRGAIAKIGASVVSTSGAQGIFARDDGDHRSDLTLTDVLVDRARIAGVVFGGRDLRADGVWVRDIEPSAEGTSGVGMIVSRRTHALEPSAFVSHTAIERASGAGLYFVGARGDVTSSVVRETRALRDGFGDGLVAAGVVFGTLSPISSTIVIRDCSFEKNARAGVAVFGSSVEIAGTRLACNTIPMNVEPVAAITPAGPVNAAVSLKDLGGNVCGCDTQTVCNAQSAGLHAALPKEE